MSSNRRSDVLPPAATLTRAAVLCHMHADPDTYLSAYALRFLLRAYAPACRVDIIIPEGMSLPTQRLAQSFTYDPPPVESEETAYDLVIAVDIGHTELLKGWSERLRKSTGLKVLIDHHPIQEGAPYDRLVVDTKASSAAELVFALFKELSVEPDKDCSQALLTAILFDSQNLSIAGEGALRARPARGARHRGRDSADESPG